MNEKVLVAGRGLLVSLFLMLLSCGGAVDEAQMLAQAREYLQQNKIQNSVIELKNILQANPENAEARYLLGEINMRVGDYATAIKEFRRAAENGWPAEQAILGEMRALEAQKRYASLLKKTLDTAGWGATAKANAMALQAVALAADNRVEEAAARLQKAGEFDATAYNVLKTAVQLSMLNKRFDEAAKRLDEALRLYPGDSSLLLLRASQEIFQNEAERAIATYQQIIASEKTKYMTPDVRLAHIGLIKLAVLQKNFDLVEASRKALLARKVNDPEVHYYLAVAAYRQDRLDEADEYLQKVLKLTLKHAPTLLLTGTVNYARQNFEQAAYYLGKYVAIEPDNAKAQKLLGRTYMALAQYEDAEKAFKQVLRNHPDDPEVIALIGLTEISGGQMQSGIRELEKALTLAPDSNSLKQQLARAYIAKGQTDDAIKQLDEVMKHKDQRYQAQYMKVLAYMRNRDFEKSMAEAQGMLDESPGNPDILNLMGNIQSVAKNIPAARAYFEKALRLHPGHIMSEMNLARLDEADSRYEDAKRHYLSVLEKHPDDSRAMVSLARVAAVENRLEEQEKWLKAARKADPKQYVASVALAELYLNQDKVGEAEALIRDIEAVHGREPAVLVVKSRLYMAQKRYIQAESLLTEFVAARPEQDVGYYLLGRNQLFLDKRRDALENLRKAYELKPDVLRNVLLLARLENVTGNFERASELADVIIRRIPDSIAGYLIKGDALTALKRYQQAKTIYDKAWTISKDRELVLRRFRLTRRLSSVGAAYSILSEWADQHPEDDRVNMELALAYDVDHRYGKAAKYYERVLKVKPDSSRVLNNLAWIYRDSKPARALELARHAYELESQSPGVMDTYGWILLKQGKTEKAADLIKLAVSKLESVPEVQYHYAVALIKTGHAAEGRQRLKALLDSKLDFIGKEDAIRLMQ